MKRKYLMLIVLCLCFFTTYASQFKIPPIVDILSAKYNVSIARISWLISMCTFAGIVLSVPGTAIMNRIGPKNLLLCLLLALGLGNLLGFFANNYPLLLLSRALEGIATALIVVVGLVMINAWFGDKGKGLAVGIFNGSGAISIFVVMNISIPIANKFGMKSIWLLLVALSGILSVLVLLFVEMPKSQQETVGKEKISFIEAIKNIKVLLLGLMMLCNNFSLRSYTTTYPQLFGNYYNIATVKANLYTSLNGLFGIVACVTCGIIIDKFKKPTNISLAGFIGLAFTGYFIDMLGPSTYVWHTIISAVLCGYVLTSIDVIAPIIAQKPIFVGYTISLVRLSYFLGAFLSTPVMLGTAFLYGWSIAKYIMVAVGLLGVVLTVLLMTVTGEKDGILRFFTGIKNC